MSTAIIIALAILGVLATIVIYGTVKYRKFMGGTTTAPSENVIKLYDSNFANIVGSGVIIVDFWAEWCKPCKIQAPIINQVADEMIGQVKVGSMDVEKSKKIAPKLGIQSIPTLIVFKDGKEVQRMVGLKPKQAIIKELNKYLVNQN